MGGESNSSPSNANSPSWSGTTDDRALLHAYVRDRSQAAFAEFVRRQIDLVYSSALRCVGGDVHLAHDVVQEVFVIVARQSAMLAQHRALEGWLYTATRFQANHAVRREQRRRLREVKADLMNEPELDSERDWRHVRPLLDDAMANLNESDRQAVIMRYFLRRSFREISDRMQVTEDAARRRVERALDKLHRLLTRRGVSSTSAALAGVLSAQTVGAAPAGLANAVSGTAAVAESAATVTTINLLHVMATSKTAVTLAVAVLIFSAGAVLYEMDARRGIETALWADQQQVDALQRQKTELEQKVAAAEALASAKSNALPPKEASAELSDNPPPPTDPRAAGDRLLATHPEARKFWDERAKSIALAKFGPMFRQFGLTPAQTDAMLDLILRQETRDTVLRDQQYVLHAEATLTPAEFERAAREILGSNFDEVPKYLRRAAAYDVVAELASSVYRTDPLQPDQIDRVANALTDASASYQAGQPFNRGDIDWDRALISAKDLLSERQLAALSELRQQSAYDRARAKLGEAANSKP